MAADALIVIDLQNDFCPGGALAVAGGDEIVPLVNDLIRNTEHVILTQDWHPAGHSSFASSHPGRQPFETIDMPYGTQTLWPDHCIQGSKGADFHSGLAGAKAELVIRKGFRAGIDSYSAFFENDRVTPTGLAGYPARARHRRDHAGRPGDRLLRCLFGARCRRAGLRRHRAAGCLPGHRSRRLAGHHDRQDARGRRHAGLSGCRGRAFRNQDIYHRHRRPTRCPFRLYD